MQEGGGAWRSSRSPWTGFNSVFLEQIVLTFLVEVFKALAQARVQRHLQVLLITLGKGFFALFPEGKSAGLGPHSRSELSADFNPSTLSAHQMPPEQLVDVPVPQIPERPGRRELLEVLRRLEEVEEATRWREQNALLAEEEVDEDEEEEEVQGSRVLPHFRPRRWCWYVQAGGICPRGWQCTFAHHESELHPDSW